MNGGDGGGFELNENRANAFRICFFWLLKDGVEVGTDAGSEFGGGIFCEGHQQDVARIYLFVKDLIQIALGHLICFSSSG